MQNDFWKDQRNSLEGWLKDGDPSLFRLWDPVRLIPLYELFHWVGYFQGVIDTSERLIGSEREKWIEAMAPRRWGFDAEYYQRTFVRLRIRNDELFTSTYNTKSNHHLESYYQLTGKSLLGFDRIVEFGGGSGDLARLVTDLGFEGEYVIVDLPEVLKVQQHNFSDCDKRLPVFAEEPPRHKSNTALVSTWALSEVPLPLRDKVVSTIEPDGWLIATQRNIFEVDNDRYFASWDGARAEIPWIRWDGGSYYIAK